MAVSGSQVCRKCQLHRSNSMRPVSRFVEVVFEPTNPVPASMRKFTRSMEFPLLSEMLLAFTMVFEDEPKNVCSVLCAVEASFRVSCCKTKRTPTLAKSRTSCVTVNVALDDWAGDAEADVDVELESVEVAIVDVKVVDGAKVLVNVFVTVMVVVGARVLLESVTLIVSVVVVDCPAMTVMVAMFWLPTAAAWTISFAVVPRLVFSASTMSVAAPTRVLWPSKVTNAFSEEQLRLPALSLDMIALPDRGTVKLVEASDSRRGRASPTVTLVILVSPVMVVVVQPAVSEVEQSKPVKPLVQMQEQRPLETTLVPPFWHVSWFWHCCSATACVLLLLF